MKSEYTPVDCLFYDILEAVVIKKQETDISYFSEDGNEHQLHGIIRDIVTLKNKGEYIVLNNDEKIRLDRIITLDGKTGPAIDKI